MFKDRLQIRPELTVQLSRQNPELFKQILVANLKNSNPLITSLLTGLTNQHLFSPKDLTLNPDSPVASTSPTDAKILLGTLAMSKRHLIKRFFMGENYSYTNQVEHIFIHELLHKLYSYSRLHPASIVRASVTETYQLARELRLQNPKYGLTVHGSDSLYVQKGVNLQATEDVVDLSTTFLEHSILFTQYLEFLTDSRFSQYRQILGLVTISKDQQQTLQTTIPDWISKAVDQLSMTLPDN